MVVRAILLIVPFSLDIIFFLLGLLSSGVLFYLMYILIIGPTLQVLKERVSQPPDEGETFRFTMDHTQRSWVLSIGLLDSDIKTRMQGILDDQLILKFRKEPGMEEYDVIVVPGKNLFYRSPHSTKLELIKNQETFESSELIGHPALFRLAASVRNNRPLQYVEYELSCDFVSHHQEEKLEFVLRLTKYYPGVDRNKPVKKGIYRFGKPNREETEESQTEEEE